MPKYLEAMKRRGIKTRANDVAWERLRKPQPRRVSRAGTEQMDTRKQSVNVDKKARMAAGKPSRGYSRALGRSRGMTAGPSRMY